MDPPLLLKTNPDSSTITNFKGKSIQLTFNEKIDPLTIKEEITIFPKIEKFKTEVKNKELTVTFQEPLQDNTTYTILFGHGIKDINEGKVNSEIKYFFSTGPFMDSLNISGTIYHGSSGQTMPKFFLGLYNHSDTLDITTDKPSYYTYSDQNGVYQFNHIKAGYYEIFAFNDITKSKTWQSNKETIGFIEQPLLLESPENYINFTVNTNDTSTLKKIRSSDFDIATQLTFNNGIQNLKFNDPITYKLSKDRKILTVFSNNPLYSILEITDSLNRTTFDTLDFNPDTSKSFPFTHYAELNYPKTFPSDTFKIKYEYSYPHSNPLLTIDSITSLDTLESFELVKTIHTPFSTTYYLLSDKDTVNVKFKCNSCFSKNLNLDSTQLKLIKYKPADLGELSGNILTSENDFIVQLIDPTNAIINESFNTTSYNFKNIIPGTYQLRVVLDKNKNGRFDTGNIITRTSPETFVLYSTTLRIRANWTLEDINITVENGE